MFEFGGEAVLLSFMVTCISFYVDEWTAPVDFCDTHTRAPQNRILVCKARTKPETSDDRLFAVMELSIGTQTLTIPLNDGPFR